MWERGKGQAFRADDQIPSLENRAVLDGVVYISNKSTEITTVTWNVFKVEWRKEPINMINPIWGDHEVNTLKGVSISRKGEFTPFAVGPSHEIAPEALNMWDFSTTVRDQPGARLYIYGRIIFVDRTGAQHDLAFTRRYDRGKGRFIIPEDINEDVEKEP